MDDSILGVEILIKKMLQGSGVCPACGCHLMVKKTFIDECFSCGEEFWKSFPKPEVAKKQGVNTNEQKKLILSEVN